MKSDRTMEQSDPNADSALVDPGPRSPTSFFRKDERAAKEALVRSTPEPIKKRKS